MSRNNGPFTEKGANLYFNDPLINNIPSTENLKFLKLELGNSPESLRN